jgi:colanic acid/amylovoran biosynthesis glycosyltransferase
MTIQGVGDAWVGNELHVLQREGIPFVLHALRKTSRKLFASDWAAELDRQTRVIYPLPPLGFAVSLLAAPFLFGRRFFAALGNALMGERESFRVRLKVLGHLLVACHWARRNRREQISHIHAQWIHAAGSVAMYGAWLLGKSFSFTGHAADLFRERAALRDKIRRAEFIVCISQFHREFFLSEGARPEQLIIAYCGIDLSLYKPRPTPSARSPSPLGEGRGGGSAPSPGTLVGGESRGSSARAASRPFHILSSGRLVEKKGFAYLIQACAILRDRGVDFRCTIGGSGPLYEPLLALVRQLKLEGLVELTNRELKQEEIPAFMHTGDVYCLQCVRAADGDIDGLPQMLMEAMACGLPAISTRLVGIPDLIIHEKTGLLCEPENAGQLAEALLRMREEMGLGRRLVEAGLGHLCERFDLARSPDHLVDRYRGKLASGTSPDGARAGTARGH